jgi:hypothetical protein
MADSSSSERVGRDEITQQPSTARAPPAGSAANAAPTRPRRPPSIRIRRLPSTPVLPQINEPGSVNGLWNNGGERTGRQRSSSAPMRPNLPSDLARPPAAAAGYLPALTEESSAPQLHTTAPPVAADEHLVPLAELTGRRRSGSQRLRRLGSNIGARIAPPPVPPTAEGEYEAEIVDMLDVVGT